MALEGLRVLDLSRAGAGPYCAMTLGDMGADVIKVEEPAQGDETRHMAPIWNGDGVVFLCFNRNKRSLALDLKTAAGLELCLQLAEKADVLVENFRPGTADRLGVGYEQVRQRNPRLIYCSVSGFGRTGPLAYKAGYDFILQGYGGVMSVTGNEDGTPVRIGYPMVDVITGLHAVGGVLTALLAREQTGQGQLVATSLFESQAAVMSWFGVAYQATGEAPRALGSALAACAPYQAFRAADRYILVGVANDGLWARFCRAMGLEDWIEDPRYKTTERRVAVREELAAQLQEIFSTQPAAHWLDILDRAGVPVGPVNNVADVLADPQVQFREAIVPAPHPRIPELKISGVPCKLSETPGSIRRPPPVLGQHTEEVLLEFGLTAAQIADLERAGVIRSTAV